MMFTKKSAKKNLSNTRINTLIGEGTEIKGDISFEGGLRIDGKVDGNIDTKNEVSSESLLTLSEKGAIHGEVHVANIIINGEIHGNVYASNHIELASKAKVNGNLYYRFLEMAIGSEVNGQLIHTTEEEVNNIAKIENEATEDEAPVHSLSMIKS